MKSFLTIILLLLSFSAYANQALFNAVEKNDEAEVIHLLANDPTVDVNFKTIYYFTPLMAAATNGSQTIVNLLLDKGAELNSADTYTKNATYYSIESGHTELFKFLVQKGGKFERLEPAPGGGFYAWSWTALNPAIKRGDLGTVNYLLFELCANPNVWQMYSGAAADRTPLMMAAEYDQTDIAKALLAAGADIDFRIPGGGWCQRGPCSESAPSAFEIAVESSSAKVARLLMDKGADQTGHGENYTFTYSIRSRIYDKHYEVAKLFAEKKVGLEADNGMWFLAQRDELEVMKELHALGVPFGNALTGAVAFENLEMTRYLVEQNAPGIPTSLFQVNGSVHLHSLKIASILLAAGADPDASLEGMTALHDALLKNRIDLATQYVKHGGHINQRLANQDTIFTSLLSCAFSEEKMRKDCLLPLFPLAKYNYQGVSMAASLLSLGADPHLRGAQGKSALELMKLLQRRNCAGDDFCKQMKDELKEALRMIQSIKNSRSL